MESDLALKRPEDTEVASITRASSSSGGPNEMVNDLLICRIETGKLRIEARPSTREVVRNVDLARPSAQEKISLINRLPTGRRSAVFVAIPIG